MSLTGYLSEYSLAEIFNFVQADDRSGLLSIESDRCLSRSMDNAYYISFQTGRIMSVSHGHGLEDRGLLRMMQQRQWLSPEQVTGLSINAHKLGQPLGTYLKSCNAIDTAVCGFMGYSYLQKPHSERGREFKVSSICLRTAVVRN